MDRTDRSPLLRSFERHLRAANRAESTVASYLTSLRQTEAFLATRDVGLLGAQRADLEAFLGDLLTRRAASTAATRYKVLRLFYQWLEEEGEVTANPTAKLRPPIVPEQPVPVVPEDGLRRLLAACAGKGLQRPPRRRPGARPLPARPRPPQGRRAVAVIDSELGGGMRRALVASIRAGGTAGRPARAVGADRPCCPPTSRRTLTQATSDWERVARQGGGR